MVEKFLMKLKEFKHRFGCTDLKSFEHKLINHLLGYQIAMPNEVIVGVLEYLNVLGRGNAFDHSLEVVLRQVDVPRCIRWSPPHQLLEVVRKGELVDFVCILLFELGVNSSKTPARNKLADCRRFD
jgi:hypothetical protein